MTLRGLTAPTLAAELGVSERVVRYWLSGGRKPSKAMARHIAHYFGISPLRVLPNFVNQKVSSGARVLQQPYDPTAPLITQNLAAARRACGLSQRTLAAQLHITTEDLRACERGGHPALKRVRYAIIRHLDALGIGTPPGTTRGRGRPRKKVTPQQPE